MEFNMEMFQFSFSIIINTLHLIPSRKLVTV